MNPQVLLHPHASFQLWGKEQNSNTWELPGMAAQEVGPQCAPTQPHRCHMHRNPLSPPFPFPHCPHLSWASLSPWKIQFLAQNTQAHPPCPQDHPVPSLVPRSGDLGSAGETAGLNGLRGFFQPQDSMIPHYPTLVWPFLRTGTCSRFPFLRKYPSHLGTTRPYPWPRSHWSS